VGACLLPESANESSSCQRLWVENDCGVVPLGASAEERECDCRSPASLVCRRLGEVVYQLRERLLKSHGSVHCEESNPAQLTAYQDQATPESTVRSYQQT
jgi:hypothetical protein